MYTGYRNRLFKPALAAGLQLKRLSVSNHCMIKSSEGNVTL
jgi:hypothetical protein